MRSGLPQHVDVGEEVGACGEEERCVSCVVAEVDGGAVGEEEAKDG